MDLAEYMGEKLGHFLVRKINNESRKMPVLPKSSRFECFLVKMVALEALQDPFFHMYTLASDEENFKSLDISGVNKIMMRQFKRDCKSSVANQFAMAEQSSCDNNNSNSNNDAGRVVRKNPGFDPVFMKV